MLGSVANQIEYTQSLLRAACLDRHLVRDDNIREEIAAMATQLEALRHRAIRVVELVRPTVRFPSSGA